MSTDRTLLVLIAVSQVVVLPVVLTYWQSDWLRKRLNALGAWTLASARARRVMVPLAVGSAVGAVCGLIWQDWNIGIVSAGLVSLLCLLSLTFERPRSPWAARLSARELDRSAQMGIHWDTTLTGRGGDASSRVIVDRATMVQALATMNVHHRSMLYFAVSSSARRAFGHRRYAYAVVFCRSGSQVPRLQYDGQYPSVDAERLPTTTHDERPHPSEDIYCFMLVEPRFRLRNQRLADLRLNSAEPRRPVVSTPDVELVTLVLVAAGR